MTATAKILLVDDTAAIRRSLRTCIETHTDWKICGEAENGKIAVDMVRQYHPDVIVIDLSMPVMNGLEAARQIGTIAPGTHILMLTLHAVPELVREAQKVGIRNVISKSDGVPNTLLHAIRSALAA
jgi:DNA-binding NarL/FixJ family response regulator